jgi:membrane-associated phospholipid phosphatase
LLTFPSGHAGVAALCAWAAWESRLLRFPVLVLNVAMATSAVSHANHYLIDIVAGIGIVGIAVSITTVLFYRQSTARSIVLDQVRYGAARFQPRAENTVVAVE